MRSLREQAMGCFNRLVSKLGRSWRRSPPRPAPLHIVSSVKSNACRHVKKPLTSRKSHPTDFCKTSSFSDLLATDEECVSSLSLLGSFIQCLPPLRPFVCLWTRRHLSNRTDALRGTGSRWSGRSCRTKLRPTGRWRRFFGRGRSGRMGRVPQRSSQPALVGTICGTSLPLRGGTALDCGGRGWR